MAKFCVNQLMSTVIFGIQASEPPPPLPPFGVYEKARPGRVKEKNSNPFHPKRVSLTPRFHYIPAST